MEHPRAKSMCIFRPPDHLQRWWLLRPSPEESSNLQQVQVISSSSSLIIYPFLWIRHGGGGNIKTVEGRASRVWDFLFKKLELFFSLRLRGPHVFIITMCRPTSDSPGSAANLTCPHRALVHSQPSSSSSSLVSRPFPRSPWHSYDNHTCLGKSSLSQLWTADFEWGIHSHSGII